MDDGRGIDPAQVRRVAVQRGILGAEDEVSDREAIQLIFSEGFSTAAQVTDVSGRGVGLDVVLKSIERLNGLVEAESIPGVGTKFIIQLPLPSPSSPPCSWRSRAAPSPCPWARWWRA